MRARRIPAHTDRIVRPLQEACAYRQSKSCACVDKSRIDTLRQTLLPHPHLQTSPASNSGPLPNPLSWWKRKYPLFRAYFVVSALVGSFLVVYFWPWLNNRVFVSLGSGEAGVLWERFLGGTNLTYIYREGFQLVMPWNRLYRYNMRLQQTPHRIVALCKNGLPVELEVSIRHRPRDGKLPLLHSVVGPNYIEVVVKPEIEAHVRAVVSQFEPTELYASEGYILNLIVQGAMREISERYISLDDLLIKRIVLPTKVADSIETKLIEEQRVFEYDFRVAQAKKEAERKEFEGRGIQKFQELIAANGSFKDYLRYAGIQATLELAKSDNAKVVVIGGADGGLPLILNMPGEESLRSRAAAPPSTMLAPAIRSLPVETPPAPTGAAKSADQSGPPAQSGTATPAEAKTSASPAPPARTSEAATTPRASEKT